MTHEERIEKDADSLRLRLQDIGRKINKELPAGWGFTMLVASHGTNGITLYISTIERADALQVMREFIANQREERNWRREMPDLEIEEEFADWWQKQEKRTPKQDLKASCWDAFLAGRASA